MCIDSLFVVASVDHKQNNISLGPSVKNQSNHYCLVQFMLVVQKTIGRIVNVNVIFIRILLYIFDIVLIGTQIVNIQTVYRCVPVYLNFG